MEVYATLSYLACVFIELLRSCHARSRCQLETPVVVGLVCVEIYDEAEKHKVEVARGTKRMEDNGSSDQCHNAHLTEVGQY